MCKTDYGGGGINCPKSDYVIYERPHTHVQLRVPTLWTTINAYWYIIIKIPIILTIPFEFFESFQPLPLLSCLYHMLTTDWLWLFKHFFVCVIFLSDFCLIGLRRFHTTILLLTTCTFVTVHHHWAVVKSFEWIFKSSRFNFQDVAVVLLIFEITFRFSIRLCL